MFPRLEVQRVLVRAALAFGVVAALSGCSHTRYVQTACISQSQYDALVAQMPPKIKSQLTGQADSDIRIIAASGVRLRGFAEGLLTVLKGCVG